jgi:hypothetical protein
MATPDCHVRRTKVAGGDPVSQSLSANAESLDKLSELEKF